MSLFRIKISIFNKYLFRYALLQADFEKIIISIFRIMENSKIIEYLKKLSKVELSRFILFANSPYNNQHKDVIALVDALAEAYPDFKAEPVTREKLFQKVFKNEPYDYMRLAHVANYTVRVFEAFLIAEQLNEHKSRAELLLVQALQQRDLSIEAERKLKKLEQKQKNIRRIDIEYLYSKLQIYSEKDKLFVKKQKREQDFNIQLKSDFLDKYYIVQKLKTSCDMLVRQNIFNTTFNTGFLKEILIYLDQNRILLEDEPLINTYLEAYKMLHIDKGEAHFYSLLKLIQKYQDVISREDLITLYDFVQNFCIRMINSGNSVFLHEIFKIYKVLLKQELVLEDQYLPAPVFKNMTTVGLRLKEYDWVENFINSYSNHLQKDIRNDVTKYNLASLYYSKKDYDNALIHLRDIDFTDVYYALGARSMLLKIYFEMKEGDLLDSAVQSFKIYLKRNKLVSGYQYNVHYNLLKYTKKVFHLQHNIGYSSKAKEKLEKIKLDIQQTQEITNKDWLMAQLA